MAGIPGDILGALWRLSPWALGGLAFTLVQVEEYAVAVVLWVLAGAVLLRQRYVSEQRVSNRFLVEIVIVFCVAAALCTWTYTKKGKNEWTAFLSREEAASAKPTPMPTPHVVPVPPESPPPPIDTPMDRIIVDVEPAYLRGLFKDHTTAQAKQLAAVYIGKWMRASGQVGDVLPTGIRATIVPLEVDGDTSVYAVFDDDRGMDRVSVLRRGDSIKVLGRISEVHGFGVILNHCELL